MFKKLREILNVKNTAVPVIEKQKDNNKNIEEILKPIDQGDLQELPQAFLLLLSTNEELKQRTVKAIYTCLKNYSPEQLVKVDILFRERTSIEWNYDFKNIDPSDMLLETMTEEEKITILGLCSFNPNGYFREKAIILLSEYKNNSVMPYIIIRLNDWVYPVRQASKEALNKRLNFENAKEIIHNLPLFFRLKKFTRDSYEEIINKVNNLLTSQSCHDLLLKCLKSNNQKVRQYCYEIIINSGECDNATLIEYVTKEKLAYIRLKVIRHIIGSLSADELKLFYKNLLKDKNPKVRSEVLYAIYKYDSNEVNSELKFSLLDKNSSVRETARILLNKKGFRNIPEFYRDAIIKEDSLVGAIYGLGETGTIEDCKYIDKYINTENIRLIHAVMVSLFKLNYEKYRELFIEKIKDERTSISQKAKKILYEKLDVSDEEVLYQISKETKYRHVQINTIMLLFKLSKWDNIKYIIEFHGSNDEEIRGLAENRMNRWTTEFNRSYTKPTEKQKKLLEEAIDKYGEFVDKKYTDFIRI